MDQQITDIASLVFWTNVRNKTFKVTRNIVLKRQFEELWVKAIVPLYLEKLNLVVDPSNIESTKEWIYEKVNEDGKEVINSSTFEEVFEKIECSKDEKGIKLSEEFWELYEKVKNYKGIRSLPDAEKSLEMKSVIALKSIITRPCDEVLHHLSFLKTLLEDINSYGTLSDFTLRRISNLDIFTGKNLKPSITEIEGLRKELGDSYLDREKEKHINLAKEIIIAIENIK